MRALGVEVGPGLAHRWASWLAPAVQPFFVSTPHDLPRLAHAKRHVLTPELRDTFKVWRMTSGGEVVWLDEHTFLSLGRPTRARLVREQVERRRGVVPTVRRWGALLDGPRLRAQADGHRFVWWPSLVEAHATAILTALVEEDGGRRSRHAEVPRSVWARAADRLPRARSLAGTFAPSSGPNCFGTVLAAAGEPDARDEWILEDRFVRWLRSRCQPGGRDDEAGTVLVWRDRHARPVHAAVTLGHGWAMEKPAQTWWTPRVVLDVAELIRANRTTGQRLERHRLL